MTTTPEVKANVKIIPARRTASYDVPLSPAAPGSAKFSGKKVIGRVNANTITLDTGDRSIELPKTVAAMDALAALVAALRAELDEQGVTE